MFSPSLLKPGVSRRSAALVAACVFGLAWQASLAGAQQARTYAVVNGTEITERDMARARSTFEQALERMPEPQRDGVLLNALIEAQLLSEAAESEGLDETAAFKEQMTWMRQQALRDVYVEQKVSMTISDADVKARYDQVVGAQQAESEIRARHILVKTEDEAKAIIAELQGGADFVELAKTKSTGPSGPNGGDLGFFGKGRMVPAFEAEAFALKTGEHSTVPVKSQFGWHIVKVEETREKPKPPFDAVKSRVRESILAERLQSVLGELRGKAEIELK